MSPLLKTKSHGAGLGLRQTILALSTRLGASVTRPEEIHAGKQLRCGVARLPPIRLIPLCTFDARNLITNANVYLYYRQRCKRDH